MTRVVFMSCLYHIQYTKMLDTSQMGVLSLFWLNPEQTNFFSFFSIVLSINNSNTHFITKAKFIKLKVLENVMMRLALQTHKKGQGFEANAWEEK